MKVAVLSSFTFDLVPQKVDKLLFGQGISAEWHVAPFNQFQQEILSPDAPSKKFKPAVVLIAIHADDITSVQSSISDLVTRASREYVGATVLVYNFANCRPAPMQFLESNTANSERYRTALANCALAETVGKLANTYLLDIESLILRYGYEKMFDPRYYYLAKMYYSAFGLDKMAEQLATALGVLAGKRKKCLVLDLDNTLWGGILGEDGLEHIKLSNDGEGRAFYDFQKSILKLYENGTILAVCSKNDEAIAMSVIERHPHMVLRKDHFSAWRINWIDKATNLESIAQELNIGLDSIVFLDDSPHERELVKATLTHVTVPDLPKDFSRYPAFVADLPYFEAFSVTHEDSERGRMYAQERQRSEIQRSTGSLEDFLQSLKIQISVRRADQFSIPRIAQLTQKTNQFTLTTRRYTEGQINEYAQSQDWRIFSCSARDTIGDAGLVGVALIAISGKQARLDTFLMSCRVIGRGIEQSFLWGVFEDIRKAGIETCLGEYIPTGKNEMARNFLESNGFLLIQDRLLIRLLENPVALPTWIEVT